MCCCSTLAALGATQRKLTRFRLGCAVVCAWVGWKRGLAAVDMLGGLLENMHVRSPGVSTQGGRKGSLAER